MWVIKELEGHGETAWEWYLRLPSFMRHEWDESDKQEFITSFEQGVNFGGFDGELKVIVHGEDKGEIMEGHLFCERDTDTSLLAATISYAVDRVGKQILLETPARHKTLRSILPHLGFRDLGLSVYRGNSTEMSFYLR